MLGEWTNITLTINPYKETGTGKGHGQKGTPCGSPSVPFPTSATPCIDLLLLPAMHPTQQDLGPTWIALCELDSSIDFLRALPICRLCPSGVVTKVDEINAVLDEQITMTQAMQFSAFKVRDRRKVFVCATTSLQQAQ
jgi:hypothetical protein